MFAIATPEEILTPNSALYARDGHAPAVAGILHNLGTLLDAMGHADAAESARDQSHVVLARSELARRDKAASKEGAGSTRKP